MPWLIYSNFAVALVLFYSWIPFVALPIFAVLENMDRRLLEAAQDLGASRVTTFLRVTLPLSLPGVIAGFVFVLIPTTGEFITPLYVGGPNNQLFGNAIQSFFSDSPDWNYGSVLALTLIVVVVLMMLLSGRFLGADLRDAGTRGRPMSAQAASAGRVGRSVLWAYYVVLRGVPVRAAGRAGGVLGQRQHDADAAAVRASRPSGSSTRSTTASSPAR